MLLGHRGTPEGAHDKGNILRTRLPKETGSSMQALCIGTVSRPVRMKGHRRRESAAQGGGPPDSHRSNTTHALMKQRRLSRSKASHHDEQGESTCEVATAGQPSARTNNTDPFVGGAKCSQPGPAMSIARAARSGHRGQPPATPQPATTIPGQPQLAPYEHQHLQPSRVQDSLHPARSGRVHCQGSQKRPPGSTTTDSPTSHSNPWPATASLNEHQQPPAPMREGLAAGGQYRPRPARATGSSHQGQPTAHPQPTAARTARRQPATHE